MRVKVPSIISSSRHPNICLPFKFQTLNVECEESSCQQPTQCLPSDPPRLSFHVFPLPGFLCQLYARISLVLATTVIGLAVVAVLVLQVSGYLSSKVMFGRS